MISIIPPPKHLLVFVFLFLSAGLFAQTHKEFKCYDTDKDHAYFNHVKELIRKSPGSRTQVKFPVRVALSINITRKTDGSGGISEEMVRNSIEHLNQVYTPSNISFFLLNNKITYIDNNKYFDFTTNDENELTQKYDVTNAVNVYLVNSFKEGMGGYAYFPSESKKTNRVFSIYSDYEDMKVKILPHEFGHYFGLFHTFQGSGSSEEEYVTRGELSNCETNGDLICDTPADPYGKILFFGGTDCNFNYAFFDKLGEKYVPMTSNIMSYYRNCGNELTAGQYELMSFGISKRLAPNIIEQEGYSILGYPFNEKDKIITGELTAINGGGGIESLCRTKEYVVKYAGENLENLPVEAWLISTNYKVRKKIGSGTSSPIKLDITDLPEINEEFHIQVVTSDESRFGTFSTLKYKLLEIPKIEIFNQIDEIFEGEKATFKGKINTSIAKIELEDEFGNKQSLSFNNAKKNVEFDFAVNKTSEYKVVKVDNLCGVGSAIGTFKVKIVEVPLAQMVKLYSTENFWCQTKNKQFNVVADGQIPTIDKITIIDTLNNNLFEINTYVLQKDKLEITNESFSNVPEIFKIKIQFKNGVSTISDAIFLAKNLDYDVSQTLTTKRGKSNLFEFKGYFTPTKIDFLEGESYTISGFNPNIKINTNENLNLTIKNIKNESCQKVDLKGQINIKINEILDFDIIREENTCVGKTYNVKIKNINGFIDQNAQVVYFDASNTERARTKIETYANNTVFFRIPESIINSGYYYIRILAIDSTASKKSNQFFVNTLPDVKISGIYGKQYLNESIIKEYSGALPIEISFSNGQKFGFNDESQLLTLEKFENGKHKVTALKNVCGTKTNLSHFIVDKDLASPSCIPQSSFSNNGYLPISKLEILDVNNKNSVYLREDWSQTENGYSDYTKSVINLKKNTLYKFIVNTIIYKNLNYSSTNGSYTIAWVDYNNNGEFEESEKIFSSSETFMFNIDLVFPSEIKNGNKLMRIQTMYESDNNKNSCQNKKPTETEDYVVNIQESFSELPQIAVSLSSSSYVCVNQKVKFNVFALNTGTNIFKGYLNDKWGNVIQDLGNISNGSNEILITAKVNNKEFLSITIEDQSNLISTSSPLFNVILPPKIKFFGETYAGVNQRANIFYLLEGGLSTRVTLDNNNNKSQIYVYESFYENSMNFTSLVVNKSSKFIPVDIRDEVCPSGTYEGFTEVHVDDKPYLDRSISGYSGNETFECSGLFRNNYNIFTNFIDDDKNYFSLLLRDNNGKFVKNLGHFKKPKFSYQNSEPLSSNMYYTFVNSHNPKIEAILSQHYNYLIPNLNLKRLDALNFENENAFIEAKNISLRFDIRRQGFSHYASSDAGLFRFKEKVKENNEILVEMPNNLFCYYSSSKAKLKFSGIKTKRNDLKIIADNKACSKGKLKIPVFYSLPFEKDNYFEYRILDQKGSILKTGKAELKNDYLEIESLDFNSSTQTYKLAVNSTNPYISSNVTEEFRILPESTAEILADLPSKKMYEGTSIPFTVNFKGTGPWDIVLNNNQKITEIRDSVFKSKIIAQKGLDSLFIMSLNSVCGLSNAKGLATFEVYELPKIEIAAFSNDTICKNLPFELEYATTKGRFIEQPRISLKLYNKDNPDDNYLIKTSNSESGNFKFNLPVMIQKGKKYYFKIHNNFPDIESNNSITFLIDTPPNVAFKNELKGFEGFTYPVTLILNTISPAKIVIDNLGTFYSNKSQFSIPVEINKNISYIIKSVSNACGIGAISNPELKAQIIGYDQASELLTIAPNPIHINNVSRIYLKDELIGVPFEVSIYDAKGKLANKFNMNTQSLIGSFIPYEFSNLPKGQYLVYFLNHKISIVKKIVVI